MNQISWPLQLLSNLLFLVKKMAPNHKLLKKVCDYNVALVIKNIKKKLAKEGRSIGQRIEVQRINNLSEKDFVSFYLKKQIPVIFNQEASSWGCCSNWNLDLIKNKFPEKEFNVIEWPDQSQEGAARDKISRKITGSDFVNSIREGKNLYLRVCPILEEEPALLADINQNWLNRMQRCLFGVAYSSFISSGGVEAPVHNESTSFFYIMAEGEKKWTLYNANSFLLLGIEPERLAYNYSNINLKQINFEKYPGADLLDRYECLLKKGDILFVPSWTWHYVETLKESWGLSYKFSSLRCFLSNFTFSFSRILISSPNIFSTLYYSFINNNYDKRSQGSLVPKLFIKR
jgi:hypothetical protein